MQKTTFFYIGKRNLILLMILISFSVVAHEIGWGTESFEASFQDKNLLKGSWNKDGSNAELQVLRLSKTGAAEVKYINSRRIIIEKAGWANSSGVLRLFVLYGQNEQSGYSLTLQYDAKRDVLYGTAMDAFKPSTTNVLFKRAK